MVAVGDKIPNIPVFVKSSPVDPVKTVNTHDLFSGKKVALFGLPGAFTPTCSQQHVPGFLSHHGDLHAKGVQLIVCISVNDAFVMEAWGRDLGVGDKVMMVGDGSGEFNKALGLLREEAIPGMGFRSKRYSMIIEADGTVSTFNLEDAGKFEVSTAECLLKQIS